MVAPSLIPSLQRPKSVIFMCPSLSSIRFSSWRQKDRSSRIRKSLVLRLHFLLEALVKLTSRVAHDGASVMTFDLRRWLNENEVMMIWEIDSPGVDSWEHHWNQYKYFLLSIEQYDFIMKYLHPDFSKFSFKQISFFKIKVKTVTCLWLTSSEHDDQTSAVIFDTFLRQDSFSCHNLSYFFYTNSC